MNMDSYDNRYDICFELQKKLNKTSHHWNLPAGGVCRAVVCIIILNESIDAIQSDAPIVSRVDSIGDHGGV